MGRKPRVSFWLAAMGLLAAIAAAACRKETQPRPLAYTSPGSSGALETSAASSISPADARPSSSAVPPLDDGPRSLDEVIRRPRTSKSGEKLAFVLWLHGLGASGELIRTVLQVDQLAERYHFAFSTPDGALDSKQRRFWNASPACCDFDRIGVDDVSRLARILDDARAQLDIDSNRLYVIGFSNGGFMAHRLACAKDSKLAGIASMAGLGPAPSDPCTPAHPLRILEVHGGADVVVRPEGGRLFDDPKNPEHPALRATVDAWAKRNHCAAAAPASKVADLIPNLPGNETTELAFAHCSADVELWTIVGGGHMSVSASSVVAAALQRLLAR